MIIIGIHDGHNSSASLSVNGEILCAVQEERFTKRKNESGFPIQCVNYIKSKYLLQGEDIDEIAIATVERTDVNYIQYPLDTVFGVDDHLDMMKNYWKPKLSGKSYQKDYVKQVFEKKFKEEKPFYEIPGEYDNFSEVELEEKVVSNRLNKICDCFGVEKEKIKFYDHHTCHIMYAYYANEFKSDKTIGITVDAYGDGRNQTVWKIEKDKFELLSESNECEIARLYRMVTLYLRMKPLEHEFKVMGLAPYAKDKYSLQVAEVFRELLQFDGLRIIHKDRPTDLFSFLEDKLKYFRFDNIAGGIQLYAENLLKELFTRVAKETEINNFVFSGGVAMNVKANMALAELECVHDMFVAGSSSDESLCIGACYYANHEKGITNKPVGNLYLGCEIDDNDVNEYAQEKNLFGKYKISKTDNAEIAKLLANGEVVARVTGKMEFGSRALGNRSILANPSNPNIVKYINELIKGRDFWMPFATTILDTYESRYLINPKNIKSKYMAAAMDTREENLNEIKAGTHPYDQTVRPQILKSADNESYYDLIQQFSELTGVGAMLNTSYNLHGLPVVNDVDDAIHVFDNSGLKYLVLGSTLFAKK